MKVSLPQSIASPQDLSGVTLEIRNYASWYLHESVKSRYGYSANDEQPVLSHAASELIRNWFGTKPATRSGFDALIKALEKYGKNSKRVTITLAAPATTAIKNILVEWFRKNVSADVLISFQINSTILGGLVVRYESRVFDWSFRRKLVEAKNNYPKVLRRV